MVVMAHRFKLLVDFNDQKYTVLVETDFKLITFRKVCNEINSQLKQIVSFETHVFEFYDKDFEEYVVITDENQLVDDLSRIRVKVKDSLHLSHSFNDKQINEKVKQISLSGIKAPKASQTKMSSADKELTLEEKVKAMNLFASDEHKDKAVSSSSHGLIDSEGSTSEAIYLNNLTKNFLKPKKSVKNLIKNVNILKDVDIKEVAISSTVDNSNDWCVGTNSNESKDKAINYLDLQLSSDYIKSPNCKYLLYKTCVIEVHNQKVIAMRYFFEDFKAIRQMLDLMDANRRCFELNRYSNSVDSPKWKTISDQMIVNGYEDWTPQKCRDGFRNAIDLYRKALDKCPDFDTADAVNPLFFVLHSYDMKHVLGVRQFQAVRDLRAIFQTKVDEKSSNLGLSTKFGSNLSLVSMNADFENQKRLQNKELIDRSKMRKMMKMTDYDINSFKALSKSVLTIVEQFGHISKIQNFWEQVSHQMKQNGYINMDCFTARNVFTEYISDYYALLLIRSPDYMSAKEVFPLFEFIHAMDLSQCLSYSSFAKIRELRHSFAQKFLNF